MWSIFSLLLLVLMLLLSWRFYWSHCSPPSDTSETASWSASTPSNARCSNTPPSLPSSEPASAWSKKTENKESSWG